MPYRVVITLFLPRRNHNASCEFPNPSGLQPRATLHGGIHEWVGGSSTKEVRGGGCIIDIAEIRRILQTRGRHYNSIITTWQRGSDYSNCLKRVVQLFLFFVRNRIKTPPFPHPSRKMLCHRKSGNCTINHVKEWLFSSISLSLLITHVFNTISVRFMFICSST